MIPIYRVSCVLEGSVEYVAEKCCNPADVARVARAVIPAGEEREYFIAIHVNAKNELKGVQVVSVGTLNASLAHPREVFRAAIVAGAASIILAHNHPSGDPEPSGDDLTVTRRMVETGNVVGIRVLDSMILGSGEKYVSLAERRML